MIFNNGIPKVFQRITEVSKLTELNGKEIFASILVVLLYLASFLSMICFILAIIVRIKNPNKINSIFFFGSIGEMELHNYQKKANQITERGLIEDLEEQIHTNSKIRNQKVNWYNNGIKFLLITIVIWFICMTFRLL